MRRPRPLARGSTVRVIEPSSPFEREKLPAGLKVLADIGLVPVHSDRIFQADGYLAGPDLLRARELVAAFSTEPGDAVIPARGGYGSMRILDEAARHAGAMEPRLFMGFSDITSLHLFFLTAGDLTTFHGPNVISMARLEPASLARLRAALHGTDPADTFTFGGLVPLTGGAARGRVVAGNLSLVTAMIGTRYAAPLCGSILALEDVSEPAYRVDRMLQQIRMQPNASGIAGFAFGDMGVDEAERPLLERLLKRFAEAMGKPAVMGFPIGHGTVNFPVPEGAQASLDADVGVLRVLDDPYDRS